MKRIILIYGLLLGIVLSINLIYAVSLCYNNPNLESNDLLGYAVMIVIFSFIFFGVRNHRNKNLNGFISFGKAMKIGTLIAVVGSTIYVIFWLFYYYLMVPDFLDVYISHVLNEAVRNGATTIELAETTTQMAQFSEMYENPLFVIIITYFEVLPVGLIVVLISALILKRKEKNEKSDLI